MKLCSVARAALLLLATPAILLGHSGCEWGAGQPGLSGARVSASAPEKVVVFPLSIVDADTYEPVQCGTVEQAAVVGQVFEGLVGYDEELNVVPRLATDWDVSSDLRSYTFKLRAGVTFHDGTPLAAADVISSFMAFARGTGDWFWVVEQICGIRAYREGEENSIAGLIASDDRTVTFQLREPDGIFLHNLAMPQVAVSKTTGEGVFASVVGAGPYVMQQTTAEDVVLKPYDRYYGSKPKVDRLVFRTVERPLETYMSGALHLVGVGHAVEPQLAPQLHAYASLNVTYAAFDMRDPEIAGNRKLRQLINAVFARSEFVDRLGDYAVPARGVLPPGMPGHRPNLRGYAQREPEPLESPVTVRASLSSSLYSILRRDLKPYGVTLKSEAPFQLSEQGWIADYPDPDDFLRILLHSAQGSLNTAGYRNPTVDQKLVQARRMSVDLEAETRMKLYAEIEKQVVEEAPWLFLWHRRNRVLISPKLTGVKLCPLDFAGALILPQTDLELKE
ncbi:ABC transporter substrate-binding protein [Planctomycetota bacterium]